MIREPGSSVGAVNVRAARPVRLSVRTAWAILAAVAVSLIAATQAQAGSWVTGGTFDAARGVGVSFLRFLAGDGEGQMTIRCDDLAGVSVDGGVTGNAELAEGAGPGLDLEASFEFVQAGQTVTVDAAGPLIIRGDGAVLVAVQGSQAKPLGRLLLEPAERVDITIAGITRPVPLDIVFEDLLALAARCDGWPR